MPIRGEILQIILYIELKGIILPLSNTIYKKIDIPNAKVIKNLQMT